MMRFGLLEVLSAAWVAAILPIFLASLPIPKLIWIRNIVMGFAKRGKIMQPSSQKSTVPQKFFCHFYVMAVAWTTLLLLVTWAYAYRMPPFPPESFFHPNVASHSTRGSHIFSLHKSLSTPRGQRLMIWRSTFILFLMEIQVLRRLYESIYVFKYSPNARMHICGYFTGLFFYAAAPLSLCCDCAPEVLNFLRNQVVECIVRRKNCTPIIEVDMRQSVYPLLNLGWCQWIGTAIFLWGWIHQRRCHSILGLLRERKQQTDEYMIPHGDWFVLASSPHYLAEIVIYIGLLIASGGSSLTIWLLLGFVVANLVFAAGETQRWYVRKFDNYPMNRYAIIPFLY